MSALSLERHGSKILVGVLCLLLLILASKGITSEGTVSLNGDMPRHMMNGAYFYDLLRDWRLGDLQQYTYEYFAQYPALSLGHHPLLLPLAEAPFYAMLGISVASARITIIAFFLLAVLSWYFLVRTAYDEQTAFVSSLLFLSSPMIVRFSRIVMSEIPALSLIILSAYFAFKYSESSAKRHLALFVVFFAAACYAKQLSIFALPGFFLYGVFQRGFRDSISRSSILALGGLGLLLVPLAAITLRYSPTNVAWVAGNDIKSTYADWVSHFVFPLQTVWTHHLSLAVVILSCVGILAACISRKRQDLFFLLWVISLYGLVVFVKLHDARISMYWIPPLCLFAAWTLRLFDERKKVRQLVLGLLVLAAGYQFVVGFRAEPERAEGYEEAASYVVNRPKGATIMYSSNVDTGYFVFFVRKLDSDRRSIVLRANKILATSSMNRITEERVSEVDEIYALLDELGTCYVVIEDAESRSISLNLLREEAAKERFELKKEIPIQSRDRRLQGVSLRIFEYKLCRPPDPDAVLDMNIPVIGESLHVRLGDILKE